MPWEVLRHALGSLETTVLTKTVPSALILSPGFPIHIANSVVIFLGLCDLNLHIHFGAVCLSQTFERLPCKCQYCGKGFGA